MNTIEVYTFEDADGNPDGEWTTQSAREAQEHARKYGLRVVARIFEYADSEVAWDYTAVTTPEAG